MITVCTGPGLCWVWVHTWPGLPHSVPLRGEARRMKWARVLWRRWQWREKQATPLPVHGAVSTSSPSPFPAPTAHPRAPPRPSDLQPSWSVGGKGSQAVAYESGTCLGAAGLGLGVGPPLCLPRPGLTGAGQGAAVAGSPSDFCEEGRPRVITLPGSVQWGSSALEVGSGSQAPPGSPSAAAPSLPLAEEIPQGPSCLCHKSSDVSSALGSSWDPKLCPSQEARASAVNPSCAGGSVSCGPSLCPACKRPAPS